MKEYLNFLIGIGVHSPISERFKQSIRFTNTVAAFILFFVLLLFSVVVFQYGFKLAAKLLTLALLVPTLTFSLNKWRKPQLAKYWISYSVPLAIITISVVIKWINPSGFTGHYEFFDLRMLIIISSIIPLLIFPRTPLTAMVIGLLPSAMFILFFDQIHYAFDVGYSDLFVDPKNGLYVSAIMFDAGYFFVVIGLLFLKKSNEELVESNNILIDDLNNKNHIQEKLLLRKQELLAQNRSTSYSLLKKQEEILENQVQLELASQLIKEQKDKLEYKNIELNSKIEERTRALKQANDELLVQNNGLLQFSNTVSHNLRAPVASLLGLVHLFEIEEEEVRKQEMLAHIKSSSVALDTVISDLNKVVDIRNQLYHLKEFVNLADEISKIEQLLKVGLNEAGVTLDIKLEIENIYFIRSYMHSILYNLISNAMKYSSSEGSSYIKISSYNDDNFISIEVEDNGLGIDLIKFGNDIFKMHKRFHDHIDGKGMGLYLVKQQVEAMNGEISIDSSPGKGTKFIMKFPITKEVDFQEYYNSPYATITYNANLKASILIWRKPPDSNEYKIVLTANKDMFANYNAPTWIIDVRNVGIISEEDRSWFASKVLGEMIRRGCKTIAVVKFESDGKDFAYWKKMLDISNSMGVLFKMFFDFDRAIEFLEEKELT